MEVLVLLALTMTLGAGRSLSPRVSTTVFGGNAQHHQPPLAVLRADAPGVGAGSPRELEIPSEDPEWAHKVRYKPVRPYYRNFKIHYKQQQHQMSVLLSLITSRGLRLYVAVVVSLIYGSQAKVRRAQDVFVGEKKKLRRIDS